MRPSVALAAVILLAGCGSVAPPSPSRATPSPSIGAPSSSRPPSSFAPSPSPSLALDRVAGWTADIDALLDARDHVHPDGWHGMKRADWIAAADAVEAKLATLTDDQALVELVRLAAMPSWNGRDGHSGIFPFIPGSGTHAYPLRFWRFPEGLVITAARAP